MILKLGVILVVILNVVKAQTSDYCSITKKHTMCQYQVMAHTINFDQLIIQIITYAGLWSQVWTSPGQWHHASR